MANAVRLTSTDGYAETFPLGWLCERKAMLATTVGGAPLSESFGGVNQLWIEGVPARLFVRDVARIDFLTLDDPRPPAYEVDGMVFQNRPNAGVLSVSGEGPEASEGGLVGPRNHRAGDEIAFEGYAYDFDVAIGAVEFSLDRGATWSRRPTPGATPERWVWWRYGYTPARPGRYELLVRAVSADGTVGLVPASCVFDVV